MICFSLDQVGWFGVIKVQSDLVMSDGVAVRADGIQVGAFFRRTKGELPESLATGIVSHREKKLVAFNPEEGVFINLDEFFTGLFEGK